MIERSPFKFLKGRLYFLEEIFQAEDIDLVFILGPTDNYFQVTKNLKLLKLILGSEMQNNWHKA